MRIGILTGGGDCPGLNAAIRACVFTARLTYDDDVLGFLDGWRGVLEGNFVTLNVEETQDLLPAGGTILGTSRTNPFAKPGDVDRVLASLAQYEVDALVAIGGEDTLGVAERLGSFNVRAVGIPKTIDNDLSGTEVSFGFVTAVQTATEAIDRLRTTAESHHRVIVCEVMGRHAGWIATYAGIASGVAEILIPEVPFDLEAVCERIRRRYAGGHLSSIVVASEGALPREDRELDSAKQAGTNVGALDAFGHIRLGGIGVWLAEEIEHRTGYECRATMLGHIQRGGSPTAYDRVLTTRLGVEAVRAVHDGDFGKMVALRDGQIVRVPLSEAIAAKTVDLELFGRVAQIFLG